MLQVKDIKFVIYGVSFEQSDVNILSHNMKHLKRKKFVFSVDIRLYIEIKL